MINKNCRANIFQGAQRSDPGIVIRFGILLAALLLFASFSRETLAQHSGGSTSPNKAETKNKADQNLKSVARVNPSTLAMEMTVPIANYPGRNGSSMPFELRYSSKQWLLTGAHTWWYYSAGGNYRRYLTDLTPRWANRTASGWTTSLLPPRIDGEFVRYNIAGQPYGDSIDEEGITDAFIGSLSEIQGGPVSSFPQAEECGNTCMNWWSYSGNAYLCTRWNFIRCRGTYDDPDPIGDGGLPNYVYYVPRTRVIMPDGSSVEFRKSDEKIYCGTSPASCVATDVPGSYLAVDGSGMRLDFSTSGPVLYLPSGARYIFPAEATSLNGHYATEFIDADGNRMRFAENAGTADRDQSWTDTLGRGSIDPIPHNWQAQTQSPGTQMMDLPSASTGARSYQITWAHLKPRGCEVQTDPNCVGQGGQQGGALEDQAQKLFYELRNMCQGNLTQSLLQNPNDLNDPANEVLFPLTGLGLRPCNSMDISRDENGEPILDQMGNPIPIPARFNPVVLTKIKLPDGSAYTFKYNRFGEITEVSYPTGARETFTYATVPAIHFQENAFSQANRGVVVREVHTETALEQRWTYAATQTGTYPNTQYKVTTIAPKGNNASLPGTKTESLLYIGGNGAYGFDSPRTGRPFDERAFDENGVMRSRTLTEYVTKDWTSPWGYTASRDLRVKRTISISVEGSNALATMTETDYDDNGHSDPTYFSHLNVKRSKSHHYKTLSAHTAENGTFSEIAALFSGAVPAAIEEFDYTYDANYKARGMSSFLTESRQLDPADNSVMSKSQVVYDNQLPATSSNYPAGYTLLGYGASSPMQCQISGQPVHNCWVDPATTFRGNPTTSRVWRKEDNTWIETHTRYDIFGNAVAVTDPIGAEATTEFASAYKYAYPTKVTTPAPDPTNIHGTNLTSSVETTYDLLTGVPLTVKDDFGQITGTEYDLMLRPTRVFGVNLTAPESQTIYGVPNTAGQFIAEQRFVKTRKQLDATNLDEAIVWADSLGRTIKAQAKDSQGDVFVETVYDKLSRVERVTNPYRVGDTVYWSKTRYDAAGRAVESYAPIEFANLANAVSLGVTSFDISTVTNFVGTVVTTTDASGRKGRSITNALGQLLRVDEPTAIGGTADADLGTLAGPHQPTFYTYSPQGKMVRVQQGVQNRYFLYDSLGRLLRVRQPEQDINTALDLSDPITGNSQWTAGFTYDILGNVLTATDAKNVVIANTYDRANRVKTRAYSGEPAGQDTPDVTFFYDGKGLAQEQTPNYAKGKLTKVESSVSHTRYKLFDNFGRLTEMEQQTPAGEEDFTNAPVHVSRYTYNLSGALIEEEYPSGRKVKNEFESDGDLLKVSSQKDASSVFTQYASNFSYTAAGGISQMRLGNGKWETAKFNTRFQITELGLGASASDAGAWKVNYDYGELDTNGNVDSTKNTGNIAKQTLTIPGTSFVQAYRYDSLYRLTEAKEMTSGNQNWIQNWGYDRYGNRATFTQNIAGNTAVTNPTVDTNTNRFNTGQGLGYDLNGNVVTDVDGPTGHARTFQFNGDNKQTEVKVNGVTVGRYFYDGEGRRVKKQVYASGVITEETVFVYSAGKLIAEYSSATPPAIPAISYTTTDHLGSPRIITNALGQTISRRDFMPFGEELGTNVGNRGTVSGYGIGDNVRQKFTGYQKDNETNLDFAEARMYENRFGRFTAVDPLLASGRSATPQTFNRYVYVGSNPLRRIDPSGEDWWDVVNRATKERSIMWFDDDPEDEFFEVSQRWTDYVYFASDQRWHALNPFTGDSQFFHDENAATRQYGLYTNFDNAYDGLFYSATGIKDLAYLTAYIRTNDFDNALGQFAYIAGTQGVGGGLARYLAPVDDMAMLGLRQSDDFLRAGGVSALAPTTGGIAALGRWGEARLGQVLGGLGEKPAKGMFTSLGYRFHDRLVNGIAHEAKAGNMVKLTSSIERQILKDRELIDAGKINGAHWHFFQGAPEKAVVDFLNLHKIPYSIY